MCQSREQGGRRCSAHQPATLGLKSLCKSAFKLESGQVDHTFRRLRREGSNRPAPTLTEYNALMNRLKGLATNNLEDSAELTRVKNYFDRELTENQLPDGATFYALKKMIPRSRDQKREFTEAIRQYSVAKGVSRNHAYRVFKQHYYSAEASQSNIYSDTFDAKTRQALDMMNDDPVNHDVIDSERRIELEPTGVVGVSMGYDPDDGRLELSVYDAVYAYHDVPTEVVDRMRSEPVETWMNLRNNAFYHYDSVEQSEQDAFGRWCRECHSYRAASGHICEPTEESDESMSVDVLEDATAETLTPSESGSELTLDAAQARIRAALEARNESQELPSRAATRMTATRRRWTAPMEDRDTVVLDSDTRGTATGGRQYSAPDPQEVKRLARLGKVVTVNFNRHVESPSYAREFGNSPNVTMTHELKFYCNDTTGDVKMERVNHPRCDCEEYRRDSTCRHIRSQSNPSIMNRSFDKDINKYYKSVDAMSKARQDAANGNLIITSLNDSVTYDTFEGSRITTYLPSARTMGYAQRILADGGRIQVTSSDNRCEVDDYPLTGTLAFEASPDNLGIQVINELKCRYCHDAVPCEHGQKAASYYMAKLFPDNAVVIDPNVDRLQQLNRVESSDWQSNKEDVDSAISAFGVGVDRSYTANLDKYLEDYREARQKVARGEDPLPYATENVTNGVCAPGAKAFGVEIEFDLPSRGRVSALDDIASEMYEQGLSEAPYMQRWHYNGRTETPYSHWSLESDSTVAGEIVSPILHDTPETWEQLQKICDIVKRHGGQASVNAGQHVHMGTVNRTGRRRRNDPSLAEKNSKILQFYAANEDAIRRVQTDPTRKSHRNTSYCSPLSEETIQNSLYNFRRGYANLGSNHNSSVNFGFDDRIEFRGADASLSPAHIQAQVMLCAGVVAAAERGELSNGEDSIKHQKVGTNARRLNAIRMTAPTDELSDDELIVSDASYRNFVTSIFNTDHGRKMMVAIAANTPWQR